jgi:hypothetical protein
MFGSTTAKSMPFFGTHGTTFSAGMPNTIG